MLFLFSILHSKMSRNMCKLCHKVRNGQNLPHESPNFREEKKFLSKGTDNLVHFSTSLRPHYQNSFSWIFFFGLTLNPRMSMNMCIWRHNLCNGKTGVGPTCTWSNEAQFFVVNQFYVIRLLSLSFTFIHFILHQGNLIHVVIYLFIYL